MNGKKKFVLEYLVNILVLMPLLCFAQPHFSVDTYTIAVEGSQEHINTFLGAFRYVGALLYKVWSALGNNPIESPAIDTLFFVSLVALVVTIFSTYIYRKLNKKSVLSYIIINISVLISVTNVWFINILTFPECIFITGIGVALCFLAIIVYSCDERPTWIRIALSSLLLIGATAIYQQFFVIFIIFTVLLSSIELHQAEDSSYKATMMKYMKLAVFILTSGIIYYGIGIFVQKIFSIVPNERVALNFDTMIDNFMYFASHQHSYLKGRGFFNTEILTLCYMIVFVIWLVSFVRNIRNSKLEFKHICVLFSYGIAYISSFMMGLVSTSRSHRAMFGLFAVFALFSIGTMIWENKRNFKIVITTVLILVFILNIYKNVEMSIEQAQVNARELVIAELYITEVEKYEEEHNKTVKNIVFCTDENQNSIPTGSSLNVRYALQSLIEYVSGRELVVREMTAEEYKIRFEGKDWERFNSEEQMIFEEETLYLCVY